MNKEEKRIKELEAEIKRLKSALAENQLNKDILQTVIELADDHYGTDLKNNFQPKLSEVNKNKDL